MSSSNTGQGGTWWCPDRDETLPLSASPSAIAAGATVEGTEGANSTDQPFAMPDFVGAQFAAVRGYWHSLRRGNAKIPFADDFVPGALGKMAANMSLVQVFEKPQRFRFDMVGSHVAQIYGAGLENRFADEITPRAPLDYFAAQCGTTVESAAPTIYDHRRSASGVEYQRLMLPFWGDGHVNAILAVFDFRRNSDEI